MMYSDHPLFFLADRLTDAPPADFARVTTPLKVGSEIDLIQSIWETMRWTECVVTYKKSKVVFWRRKNKTPRSYRMDIRQMVRTR
jgi:hypothetical protein